MKQSTSPSQYRVLSISPKEHYAQKRVWRFFWRCIDYQFNTVGGICDTVTMAQNYPILYRLYTFDDAVEAIHRYHRKEPPLINRPALSKPTIAYISIPDDEQGEKK